MLRLDCALIRHSPGSVWLLTLLLSLTGCSGNGIGLDANGDPLNGGTAGSVPLSADFDSIQANVFTPICSVCHSGATAPEGLMLDAQHSYNLLVNVPSTEVPSLLRVDPGNPSSSYIIQKLEGHAAVGAQMPLGQPPLPATTIAFIAQWITDGAAPGSAGAAMAESFEVAAVAPEDAAALPEPPARMAVMFTRELDVSRVDASSARLERLNELEPSAAVAEAEATVSIPIQISVPAGNARTLLLTPREALRAGRYRIALSEDAAHELRALDGARLSPARAEGSGNRIVSTFTVRTGP